MTTYTNRYPEETARYYVTDSYGRSYFAQPFSTREAAITAAKQLPEHERPFGAWLASDGSTDEEIVPATDQ